MSEAERVLAVDPGREKCGVAVVDRKQGARLLQVIPTADLASTARELVSTYALDTVVIGDGTTSGAARAVLLTALGDHPVTIVPVDERCSTEEARRRYWRTHPPRGWRRLLPVSMLSPSEPVDDGVAVILAERYWQGRRRRKIDG